METRVNLLEGKYTVVHENGEGLKALRYGEPWRDLTGDGLVLALVQRIEELDGKSAAAIATLENLGYQWHGGTLFKPPLGKKPDWLDEPGKDNG